jgi:hypothetical protein
MVVEIKSLRAGTRVPACQDVPVMFSDEGGVPRAHQHLGGFGASVVVEYRLAARCKRFLAAARTREGAGHENDYG